jgi:hypothetical protein
VLKKFPQGEKKHFPDLTIENETDGLVTQEMSLTLQVKNWIIIHVG